MATFFGEISEVSSRAVWWSDSDDEEEDNKPKAISLKTTIVDEANFETFLARCNRLFITTEKYEKHSDQLLATIVAEGCGEEGRSCELVSVFVRHSAYSCLLFLVNVCSLYQLEGGQYWLVFNAYFPLKQYHNVPLAVDQAQRDLLDRLASSKTNKLLMVLVSCQNDIDQIQYISSRRDGPVSVYLDEVNKSVHLERLQAPSTVRGPFGLALLERSIIYRWSMVCLLLPLIHDQYEFIPKVVANSGDEYRTLSYSNIIT